MSFIRGILFFVNLIVGFFSIIAIYCSLFLPSKGAIAGFLMLMVPIFLFINLLFVFYWLAFKWQKSLLSIAILIFAWPLIMRSFSISSNKKIDNQAFSILSYNVFFCDATAYVHQNEKENSPKLIKAMTNLKADIKCIQELYNWDSIEHFKTIDGLKFSNPNYVIANNKRNGFVGLAIFSKYPILNSGYEQFNYHNGVLWADVSIQKRQVRIINVQLFSMGIRVNKVLDAQKNNEDEKVKEEAKNVISQLKDGFRSRAKEVDKVIEIIEKSPYPVILAGDFNELPYGYAYGKIRKKLNNAFEDAGNGFGFTYNKNPKFIRIDNQFYDKKLTINGFTTLSKIDFSDHYPIFGKYSFK